MTQPYVQGPEPDISVIIPTHRRNEGLQRLLEDLCRQDLDPTRWEAIVVDSEAGDGSHEIVSLVAAKNGVNISYAESRNVLAAKRNVGAKNAAARILAFVDDDMRLPREFLSAHLAAHTEQRLVVCGQVRFPPERMRSSNYVRFKNSRHFNDDGGRDRRRLSYGSASAPLKGNHFVAMNFSISRTLYWELGGFDEAFEFYGGEDVEFGIRAIRLGAHQHYSSAALAVHDEVDMGLGSYLSKAYRAAYSGTPLVLVKAPEARSIVTFRLTEPGVGRGLYSIGRLVLRAANATNLTRALQGLLEYHDTRRAWFQPSAFVFLSLAAQEQAAHDRHCGRRPGDAHYRGTA